MIRFRLPTVLLAACLFLAACAQDGAPPPPGSFTIRIEPAAVELRAREEATVQVQVLRSAGFSDAVTLTLSGDTSGLEAQPVTVAGAAGSLAVVALATAEPGARVVMVTASSGGKVRYEPLSVVVLEAAAVATDVVVTDGTGAATGSVRQGAGPVTLAVTGSNLSLANDFSLAELPVSLLPGSTDSQLQLEVVINHGATVGIFDLVLVSGEVATVLEGVLEVTPISVAETGSDTEGRGTRDSPFRSLSHALGQAGSGDTLVLAPGIYSEDGGESWPLLTGASNVPAGVTIKGAGATLQGPGAEIPVAALSFAAGGTSNVHDLTVSGFGVGFRVTDAGAEAELLRSTAAGNGAGATVEGALLRATDSAFGSGELGLQLLAGSEVMLTDVVVHSNTESGIRAEGGDAVLSVTGGLLRDNAMAGLWFDGARLTLRNTEIRDNAEFGLYIEGEPLGIDLGTLEEEGGNSIHGNGPGGTGDQLLDVRPARATLGVPVIFTISATTLAGVLPVPDVYVGHYIGYPLFSILGENNTIQIY